MTDDFWGPKYGPARRVAWRRLWELAVAGFFFAILVEAFAPTPPAVQDYGLSVALAGLLVFVVRYLIAEVMAIHAFAVDSRHQVTKHS